MKTSKRFFSEVCGLIVGGAALLGLDRDGAAQMVSDPYVPSAYAVSLTHRSSGGHEWIDVTVDLPTPCHYASSWGSPIQFGSQFQADTAFYSLRVICVQVITPVSHSYDLGPLPAGTYQFIFSAFGQPLAAISFVAGAGTPLTPRPEQVHLKHRTAGSNETMVATVDLMNSCQRLLSWGTASRSGSTFATDATLRQTGSLCFQVVTTVSNVFDLGPLSPGMYAFVFSANGAAVKTNRFTVPDSDTDSDGDGVSDWHEYLADTDPHDPRSKLCLTRIAAPDGRLCLEWQGGIRATQVLQQACGWGANGLVWRDVLTNAPPTLRTVSSTNLLCTNGMSLFRIHALR